MILLVYCKKIFKNAIFFSKSIFLCVHNRVECKILQCILYTHKVCQMVIHQKLIKPHDVKVQYEFLILVMVGLFC